MLENNDARMFNTPDPGLKYLLLSKVVYVAKRNIRSGEQVTDCYGIHHLSIGLDERQALLSRGYRFKCLCEACNKNFPLLENLDAKVKPDVALKLGHSFSK